jgi:hypothetical protein
MTENEWIFKVVFKANGQSSADAEEKIVSALMSIDDQQLTEQPYILSYESDDGLVSG